MRRCPYCFILSSCAQGETRGSRGPTSFLLKTVLLLALIMTKVKGKVGKSSSNKENKKLDKLLKKLDKINKKVKEIQKVDDSASSLSSFTDEMDLPKDEVPQETMDIETSENPVVEMFDDKSEQDSSPGEEEGGTKLPDSLPEADIMDEEWLNIVSKYSELFKMRISFFLFAYKNR